MAIAHLPHNLRPKTGMFCALCRARLTLSSATVGLPYADNTQALACVSHFSEPTLLIVGWADFIAAQRFIYTSSRLEIKSIYERVVNNAWLDT